MAVGSAGGQDPRVSTTRTAETEELPPDVLERLGRVADFSYDFDEPGYYALLGFVRASTRPPGSAYPPTVVADWRELVERPSDFRGLAVTIEGVVGRNKAPYMHGRHPELGQVWQVELSRPDQAPAFTVIFTSDVSDLPVGDTIRVTGYFVKVYRYPTRSQTPGLAALVVAPGPTVVSRPAPHSENAASLDWRWLTVAIVAALIATVILLRRSARGGRHDVTALRARQPAPLSLADDLEQWAQREQSDEPASTRKKRNQA